MIIIIAKNQLEFLNSCFKETHLRQKTGFGNVTILEDSGILDLVIFTELGNVTASY